MSDRISGWSERQKESRAEEKEKRCILRFSACHASSSSGTIIVLIMWIRDSDSRDTVIQGETGVRRREGDAIYPGPSVVLLFSPLALYL